MVEPCGGTLVCNLHKEWRIAWKMEGGREGYREGGRKGKGCSSKQNGEGEMMTICNWLLVITSSAVRLLVVSQ